MQEAKMDTKNSRRRLIYAMIAAAILIAEVIIALFVRDQFIRPYFGDVLAVVLIYYALKAVLPLKRHLLLPLLVFLFAAAVEVSQLLGLVTLLGLGDVAAARIILGGTFSWGDILCYAAGCAFAAAAELLNL